MSPHWQGFMTAVVRRVPCRVLSPPLPLHSGTWTFCPAAVALFDLIQGVSAQEKSEGGKRQGRRCFSGCFYSKKQLLFPHHCSHRGSIPRIPFLWGGGTLMNSWFLNSQSLPEEGINSKLFWLNVNSLKVLLNVKLNWFQVRTLCGYHHGPSKHVVGAA